LNYVIFYVTTLCPPLQTKPCILIKNVALLKEFLEKDQKIKRSKLGQNS